MSRAAWLISVVAFLLAGFGCLAIGRCDDFESTGGSFQLRQLVWIGLGAVAAWAASRLRFAVILHIAYGVFALVLILLVAVYFSRPINGAYRWLRLGPVGIQPSEFAKVALVLALARWLRYREQHRHGWAILAPLAITTLPMVLILREPDLGTALVFPPVLAAMLLAAGARRSDLLRFALAGVVLAPVLWGQMSREQRSRVVALFEQTRPGERPSDDSYQLHQAKQMMALGGWWGSALAGPAVSDDAAYYLPEAHSDFIFCVVGERFGVWGMACVLAFGGLLVAALVAVAGATSDPFQRLVVLGIASLFAVEFLVNTGMTVGLLPVTGLPLPLVSYGGSGVLSHAAALGLALNVALRPRFEVAAEPFRYRADG